VPVPAAEAARGHDLPWVRVAPGDAAAAAAWERTLERGGVANRYLRPAWLDVYRRAYGLSVCCVAVPGSAGLLDLVLPLVRVRSLLFGDGWIGLPFVTDAGLWWDPEALSAEAAWGVVEAAAGVLGRAVQVRGADASERLPGAPMATGKAVFRRDLPATVEALWATFPPKLRSQVRRATKAGFTVREGGSELLGAFYGIYSETMRDLGSPPHGRRFFELALEALGAHARVLVVDAPGGDPAAAGFLVRHGDRLEIPWAGSLGRFKRDAPNMLLYERAMAHAIARECGVFEFGRSTVGSGQARFKLQWGASAHPLGWTGAGAAAAEPGVPGAGRGARAVSAVWSRLPLWLVRALGPHLIRRIPA